MPFHIIISEKGGAERRETFDKNEINVGRVQGNDLMLPKGNVSKHHARLLYRDGRFIVTDLKSTNGTYVNGRKITQATIVREGDKIYIGDFVIRLDLGGAGAQDVEQGQPTAVPGGDDLRPMPPLPGAPGPTHAPAPMGGPPPVPPMGGPPAMPSMGGPPPVGGPPPMPSMGGPPPMPPMGGLGPPPMPPMAAPPPGPAPMPPPMAAPPPGPAPMPPPMAAPAPMPSPPMQSAPAQVAPSAPRVSSAAPVPSHIPLERDPDESVDAQMPSPPRVPTAVSAGARGPMQGPSPSAPPVGARASSPAVSPRPSMAASPRLVVRESPAQAARRLGLTTLVDRVADAMDLAPLSGPVDDALSSRVQQAVKAQADAMKAEGEVPGGLDLSVLVADATRELTGLGAVAPLLEDDEVAEIHCTRHDQIVCIKGGQSQLADVAFSSDAALGRVIARLARLSGQAVGAGEVVVERHLPRGAHMLAFIPPASMGHALVVRKRRRVDMSMEDFVRLAAMSRPMVAFLEQCLAARANVLVSAPQAALAGTFLGALTTASAAGERVALLLEHEDVPVSHAQVLALAGNEQTREQLLRAAARTRPDRLVVGTLTGPLVAAALEAVAEGAEGVLASVCAPSLRQALTRMVAQLVLSRPGLGTEAARELVGESFDIALEVTLFGDGRMRVNRLAELAGSDAKGIVARDLFVADGEGHTATGVVPRALGEFAARGVKVDANLFKKGR